jgi:hypothetical protein
MNNPQKKFVLIVGERFKKVGPYAHTVKIELNSLLTKNLSYQDFLIG